MVMNCLIMKEIITIASQEIGLNGLNTKDDSFDQSNLIRHFDSP